MDYNLTLALIQAKQELEECHLSTDGASPSTTIGILTSQLLVISSVHTSSTGKSWLQQLGLLTSRDIFTSIDKHLSDCGRCAFLCRGLIGLQHMELLNKTAFTALKSSTESNKTTTSTNVDNAQSTLKVLRMADEVVQQKSRGGQSQGKQPWKAGSKTYQTMCSSATTRQSWPLHEQIAELRRLGILSKTTGTTVELDAGSPQLLGRDSQDTTQRISQNGGTDTKKRKPSSSTTWIPSTKAWDNSSNCGLTTTHLLRNTKVDQNSSDQVESSSPVNIQSTRSGTIQKQEQQCTVVSSPNFSQSKQDKDRWLTQLHAKDDVTLWSNSDVIELD